MDRDLIIAELQMVQDIFLQTTEITKGSELPYWYEDAEVIVHKILSHICSAKQLLFSQTPVDFNDVLNQKTIRGIITDYSSIVVLTRAAYEAYWTFSYLFVTPVSTEESEFRHLAWEIGGIRDRLKLELLADNSNSSIASEHRQVIDSEKKLLNEKIKLLETNSQYINAPLELQKRLTKGEWRGKMGWVDVAANSGLSRNWAICTYAFQCAYAHTSGYSILQLKQMDESIRNNHAWYLHTEWLIIMSFVVQDYIKLFPEKAEEIQQIKNFDLIEKWYSTGVKWATRSE